jgi:diadenosine tetraphosphatase ApaH/serine/threonine PP2A family protein phosphatase
MDTETNDIEMHRVDYDIATAQQKILDAGLPEELAERLSSGR